MEEALAFVAGKDWLSVSYDGFARSHDLTRTTKEVRAQVAARAPHMPPAGDAEIAQTNGESENNANESPFAPMSWLGASGLGAVLGAVAGARSGVGAGSDMQIRSADSPEKRAARKQEMTPFMRRFLEDSCVVPPPPQPAERAVCGAGDMAHGDTEPHSAAVCRLAPGLVGSGLVVGGFARLSRHTNSDPDAPVQSGGAISRGGLKLKTLATSAAAVAASPALPTPPTPQMQDGDIAASDVGGIRSGMVASDRDLLVSKMASLEATLRFLELDIVSLLERSRDDLYEIDFWRCAPEDDILAARRGMRKGKQGHDQQLPPVKDSKPCKAGDEWVPQLAKKITPRRMPKGSLGEVVGPQLAKQISTTPKGADGAEEGAGEQLERKIAQLHLVKTQNRKHVNQVLSAAEQLAKMRQRGGASRVELQMLVTQLELQVEEERAKRADAERRLALVTLPPHTPLTAAAAAGDKQGWSGIDEGERQQGSGNQVGGILLGADLGLGAFREMCDRLENEKTEAVQRLDEAQQCLVTAQGQLARRNKEAAADGRRIANMENVIEKLQLSLREAQAAVIAGTGSRAMSRTGAAIMQEGGGGGEKPVLASVMASNQSESAEFGAQLAKRLPSPSGMAEGQGSSSMPSLLSSLLPGSVPAGGGESGLSGLSGAEAGGRGDAMRAYPAHKTPAKRIALAIASPGQTVGPLSVASRANVDHRTFPNIPLEEFRLMDEPDKWLGALGLSMGLGAAGRGGLSVGAKTGALNVSISGASGCGANTSRIVDGAVSLGAADMLDTQNQMLETLGGQLKTWPDDSAQSVAGIFTPPQLLSSLGLGSGRERQHGDARE